MDTKKQIAEIARDICCVKHNCNDVCHPTSTCQAFKYAERAYNADYRKQSEGVWIEHDDDWCGSFYTCSVCKCDWTTIDGTPQENNMRYCPECGAKMKGGAE